MKKYSRIFFLPVKFIFFVSFIFISGCNITNQKDSAVHDQNQKISEITIAANGGVMERAIRDLIGPEFTKKTGIQIHFIAGLSSEIVARMEASKGNPTIDVAFIEPIDVLRVKEKGLTETLAEADIPNIKQLDKAYTVSEIDDVWVPIFGFVVAPAYQTKSFEEHNWKPIHSWRDLADPQFKGRTAYVDVPNSWALLTLYFLALSEGGSFEDLEPGLKKAKEMARISETFYKNSTQVMPVIQQGEADISVLGSYVVVPLYNQGVPIKLAAPEEGVPLQATGTVISKGTARLKESQQFIDYFLSASSQSKLTDLGFFPVVKNVMIPEQYVDVIGMPEGTKMFMPSPEKLMKLRGIWSDRWMQEVRTELGKDL
ncbi:MAG: extracellular solute-binding protein [Candidatus Carbobacillus sp.]|nr:extracellular solute-binding protein [Candidatus Carbobacillus sp.]